MISTRVFSIRVRRGFRLHCEVYAIARPASLIVHSVAVGLLGIWIPFSAWAWEEIVLVGTVVHVTDGDTIKVMLDSGSIADRLDSIDAPEASQPWGREATAALARRLGGQEVTLAVTAQDRYERLVAVVYLADQNVNAWMVQQGNAWAYRQYLDDEEYCDWEGSARVARRGLWSLPSDEWRAPWEWRHGRRGGIGPGADYADETVADCIAVMRQSAELANEKVFESQGQGSKGLPGNCVIKGNIGKRGHIFHVPGSRSYESTKISADKGERWFCTEDEARAAGWVPPRP